MTTLLAEAPSLFDAPSEERRDGGEGAGLTLDGMLSGAWEGLAAHAAVACPLCHGDMRPHGLRGAAGVTGRCLDCGTALG